MSQTMLSLQGNGDLGVILCKAERGERLEIYEVEALLNVDPAIQLEMNAKILNLSRSLKFNLFQGEVYPLAPLYVSSICQEHCLYCNYRVENKHHEITRLRLSDDDLKQEVRFLADKGLRVVELVYAADPHISIDDVARHIQITRTIMSAYGKAVVGINARPFTVEGYRKLKAAGLDFAVLWQETFDRRRYEAEHPEKSEKADFDYRFGAHERMLEAGIHHVGIGVLSGLSDWRKDWLALIQRADYLKSRYRDGLDIIILGIPRLKVVAGVENKTMPFVPSDDEFQLAIAVFNICFPAALPFVSTRESWDMCVNTAKGGGTLFTLNCKTIPGGYALGHLGYQFPTHDFGADKYIQSLASEGLVPVFDWDFAKINNKTAVHPKLVSRATPVNR